MAELKGSKTEQNLRDAFAGESQARNKYTYFASVAKKEGYEQIASLFLLTAEQEKEHAKLHFKALAGVGDTLANLKAAAAGEHEEWTEMYPRMAQEARAEGFCRLGQDFRWPGQDREGTRSAVPGPTGPAHARHRVRQEGKGPLGLPQLRVHLRRYQGRRQMPDL